MVGWRRILAVLGVAAAAVLLSGCDLQGHVDVISPDDVSLDLLVSDDGLDCASLTGPDTVTYEPGPDVAGSASCHITGTLPLADLGFDELHTDEVGEYWTFTGTLSDVLGDWPDVDLDVRFPGDVVEASQGTIQGNTLRLNPSKFTRNEIRVVARNRPGPENWVVAAAAGLAAGIVLTLAVVGLFRRARRVREAPAAPAVLESARDGREQAPATEQPPAAPGAGARPVPEAAAVEVDHAWFATPPEPSSTAPGTSQDAGEPPDHSMWAPPEHR